MRKTMHALGSKWSCSTRKSSIFGIKLSHSTVVKNPLFDLFDHRQPKLHLWDDHNSNGEIIGVCIYIYIYIYIYKVKSNSYKKYLTLPPQCIAWYLSAYFVEGNPFREFSISRFSTYIRKAQGCTFHFRNARSETRKIQTQNDRVATNPTQNPSTYIVVSF